MRSDSLSATLILFLYNEYISKCSLKCCISRRIRFICFSSSGKTLRAFEPVYPDNLCIDLKTFCNAFPFHIVFDEEVRDD